MNRSRRLLVLSLISCIIIFLSSITGVILSVIQYGLVSSIRTYGIIMNLFLIIGSICLIVYDINSLYNGKDKTSRGIYLYMLICSVGAITASIFLLILYPNSRSIIYKFSTCNIFLHVISPLFAFILVLITIIKYPFEIKDTLYCMSPALFYGAIYFIMILAGGKNLDYYGLYTESNLWFMFTYLLFFVAVSFLISIFIILIHNNVTSFGSNSKLMLRNGVGIPRVGFGTWTINNEEAEKKVEDAISVGYTHIDTAAAYGNEEGVGRGIKASGMPRKKMFIATKIPAEVKDYESAQKAIEESLKKLDTGYVDLMMIHAPQPWEEYGSDKNYDEQNIKVWKAMEEAYMAGKIKAIGVSNFNKLDIENIINHCKIPPMVNQICCYAGNTPLHLIKFCQKHKIVVEAYAPLGDGNILKDKRLEDMALKYKISIPRLCVRYTIDLGCVSLPKSSTIEHMKENFDTDIKIKKPDVELIANFADRDFAEHRTWPIYYKRSYYEIDK